MRDGRGHIRERAEKKCDWHDPFHGVSPLTFICFAELQADHHLYFTPPYTARPVPGSYSAEPAAAKSVMLTLAM